jgi:hypothetical protein
MPQTGETTGGAQISSQPSRSLNTFFTRRKRLKRSSPEEHPSSSSEQRPGRDKEETGDILHQQRDSTSSFGVEKP